MYKNSTKGKFHRLVYLMNQNISIKVKSSVWVMEARDTIPNVGQGTVEGAMIIANNHDGGIKEYFHDDSDTGN